MSNSSSLKSSFFNNFPLLKTFSLSCINILFNTTDKLNLALYIGSSKQGIKCLASTGSKIQQILKFFNKELKLACQYVNSSSSFILQVFLCKLESNEKYKPLYIVLVISLKHFIFILILLFFKNISSNLSLSHNGVISIVSMYSLLCITLQFT